MEIRLAEEKDFDEIAYIEKICFDSDIAYSKEKLLKEYNLAKERFYVVEIDKVMVAYFWSERWKVTDGNISFRMMKDSIHTPHGNVLYIGNISVLPEMRGRKIAQRMMKHMLADLPTVQYSVLAVPIGSVVAKMIYEKLGYKQVHYFEDYYTEGKGANVMVLPGGRWHETMRLNK